MMIFVLLGLLLAIADAKIARATFNFNDAYGTIEFEQASPTDNTTIRVNLSNLPGTLNYHVHLYPVYEACTSGNLGGHWNPTGVVYNPPTVVCNPADFSTCEVGDLSGKFGTLSGGTFANNYSDPTLTLFGEFSIVGRSINIHWNSTWLACATIKEVVTTVKELHVSFGGSVGGYVKFWQDLNDPTADTSIYIRLTSTNSFSGALQVDTTPVINRLTCANVGAIWNPTGASIGPCLLQTTYAGKQANCEVGNLAARLGPINIPGQYFFTQTSVPLSGINSIARHTLSILNTSLIPQDCSPIGKYVEAVFRGNGVVSTTTSPMGYISFFQPSIYETTDITVNLFGLQYQGTTGNGYHIHKFPPTDSCSTTLVGGVGGHFDPFGAGVSLPYVCNPATPDLCEVGDLSGKHGKLTTVNVSTSYQDDYVDLFGTNSIVGRSVVIHHASDDATPSVPWICVPIGYPKPSKTVTTTYFGIGDVWGTVIYNQPASESIAETSVYVTLWYGQGIATSNHNWHIHVNSVYGDCSSVGGHYNPRNVIVSLCASSTDKAMYCELGDLAGKLGQLSIGPASAPTRFFFTDSNLPLSGANTIGFRSTVVHASGTTTMLSCASNGKQVVADFGLSGSVSGGVTGRVEFLQASPMDSVAVDVHLQGLTNIDPPGNGYHVHLFPLPTSPNTPSCSNADIAGHWNPTMIDTTPGTYNCNPGNPGGCEIGDLAGRNGFLDTTNVSLLYADQAITLFGSWSIVDRSIVIHQSTAVTSQASGARYACATISPIRYGGPLKTVYVPFRAAMGDVAGLIQLSQLMNYPGSETSLLLNLNYNDTAASPTMGHNWHIHVNPVTGIDCLTTGGHFNPWLVDLSLCPTSQNKARDCEVGDLAGKHGQLDLQSSSTRYKFTDSQLPLSGSNSIDSRAITIHVENGGAARLACANISTMVPQTCSSWSCGTGYLTNSPVSPLYCAGNCDDPQCCGGVQCPPLSSGFPTCTCNVGYLGGALNWNGTDWTGLCTLANCPSDASQGPNCACNQGFRGVLQWVTNAWTGTCNSVSCPSGASGHPNCTCGTGYTGTINWNGTDYIGTCSMMNCPANSTGHPNCQCVTGYIGAITWNGASYDGTCAKVNCPPSSSGHPSCACNNGYAGTITWNGTDYNGICSMVNCPTNSSGHPNCVCNNGFTGAITWSVNNYLGTCSVANCPPFASGAPSCACTAPATGALLWQSPAWTGTCTVAPCPPDSTLDPVNPSCSCNNGYRGAITYVTNAWAGPCTLAQCPSHAMGAPSCTCATNYMGSLAWNRNSQMWDGQCTLDGQSAAVGVVPSFIFVLLTILSLFFAK